MTTKKIKAEKIDWTRRAQLPVFCEEVLKIAPYQWQLDVWRDVAPKNCRVALRAANGSGKTSVCAAPIAAWNAMTAPESTTVVTSGVMRQIKEQFWPALRRVTEPLAKDWGIEMTTSGLTVKATGSTITGFTAVDAFKFEGYHRTGPSDNLLIIVDEAKSINPDIFHAIERMQPSRLLMQSSPGPAVGAFYNAWSKERDLWKKHVVQAKDCPHLMKLVVTKADGSTMPWIDSVIKKYGVNAPITKSMIFADWMSEDGEKLVCPLHWYERCLENPPERNIQTKSDRALGIDVAAGGDENVVAYREGNEVKILEAWHGQDTFQAAVRIAGIIKRLNIEPGQCFLDVGGLGVGFADALNNMGFEVSRVNFGGRAFEDDNFMNRGTEMWVMAGRKIEECGVRLPDDDDLKSQFTTRRYVNLDSGKTRLESKDDMRRRGLHSPDRADAVVMALTGQKSFDELTYGEMSQTPMDKLLEEFARRQADESRPLPIPGMDVGY